MLRNRIFRSACLGQRPRGEAVALPSVNVVDHSLLNQLVTANPGQDLGPHKPVDTTRANDAKADNAVDVVGKALVDVLALGRRHKRRNDEVDVAEAEESGDGDGCLDRGVPVEFFAVAVEVDEAGGDKGVDDGEGV